jgi:DNA-binding transcriptional LysR family regulator
VDRLDAMSVLLAVVEAGSLSAGARRLGAPLASVSRKVADLEKHLGTQLVLRTSRRSELTEAGRAYAEAAKRILEQVDEAERAAAGEYDEPRGELAVTAPVPFGRIHLVPVAVEFLAAHPNIDLRMMLTERNVNLVEEHIQVAVRMGQLDDSALVSTRIGQIRPVTCASPAYLERRGVPLMPEELGAHDCVTLTGFANLSGWTFKRGGAAVIVEPRSRFAVNTAEAAIAAATAGLGVTRVQSYQAAEALRSGALQPVLESFAPEPVPVSLVYASQGLLPLKVRAFLDWSAPRLRARLA